MSVEPPWIGLFRLGPSPPPLASPEAVTMVATSVDDFRLRRSTFDPAAGVAIDPPALAFVATATATAPVSFGTHIAGTDEIFLTGLGSTLSGSVALLPPPRSA